MTVKGELRLFVWPAFAPDYTDGLAFAIAETVEEAQQMIMTEQGYSPYDWGQVREYTIDKPIAYACSGGG